MADECKVHEGSAGDSAVKKTREPKLSVVVVPGNGCAGRVEDALWYGWLGRQLRKHGVECRMHTMPDPYVARESKWIPFMRDHLRVDASTVIVGHSSGAVAAMRFAETDDVAGIVLVSACHTDLGDANERKSGYYSRPWQWGEMVKHTSFIDQFGSTDDPFIPWDEMQHVADNLQAHPNFKLHKYSDQGHFNTVAEFPALLKVVLERVGVSSS